MLARKSTRVVPLMLRMAGQFAFSLCVMILLLSGCSVAAEARELRIRNIHAELVVLPNSALDVTETITAQFIGSWQGLYRTIPVEYPGPGGFNYSLFLKNITAHEGSENGPTLR